MLLSSRFPMLLQYRQFYSSMTSLQSDEADNTCTVIILIMSFLAINRHLLLLCYAYYYTILYYTIHGVLACGPVS